MRRALWKPNGEHILKKREVAGFTLTEARYPPGLEQPRHTHELASFSLVLDGSYVEKHGRQEQTRRSATVVFHPPRESHAVSFRSDVRILGVQIDSRRLTYLREHSAAVDSSASCRSAAVDCLGRRMRQEFRLADAASALAIEGLILEVLAEVSRDKRAPERKSPRWLERATEFLHDNFSEPLVYEGVARAAGVHPVHLARVFRERRGYTMGEYVRRLRVESARRQISETETPFSEIALASGFADHSHLTRAFKKRFGLTPSEYRKILRGR